MDKKNTSTYTYSMSQKRKADEILLMMSEYKQKRKSVKLEQDEEKWLTYYSSKHKILLVGEGDFSFSLCLARAFGSASNIYATSLDSHDELVIKYKNAKCNLEELQNLGASLLHGVDASSMKFHPHLKMVKFDRTIFNFPHAGFGQKETDYHQIELHKKVVYGFFDNASNLLLPNGEIHVNHKTDFPYSMWNLEGLALMNSLDLTECIRFNIEDYPGYNNKRGVGPGCDNSFKLGDCSTFKFKLGDRSTLKFKLGGRSISKILVYDDL
ncbi:hypothetical protein ACFE04_024241 [Oxalis oulophora]